MGHDFTGPTMKLTEVIKMISKYPRAGWEYLGLFDGQNYYFLPSNAAVEEFKKCIGDKWNVKIPLNKIGHDLFNTNMSINGHYLMANGGLCPGQVRLIEISDISKLHDLINVSEENRPL